MPRASHFRIHRIHGNRPYIDQQVPRAELGSRQIQLDQRVLGFDRQRPCKCNGFHAVSNLDLGSQLKSHKSLTRLTTLLEDERKPLRK